MLVALLATVSVAQERGERGERPQRPNKEQMSKMKIKRMVKELALDNKTAEEFTATYTEYQQEIQAINSKYANIPDFNMAPDKSKSRKDMKEEPLLTDEEVEKQIKDGFARERALLDLKEKYYDKFIKFLTPQQIQKMYQMENAPRARMQNGNMQPPQGGFPGGPMGGMTPPPGMW